VQDFFFTGQADSLLLHYPRTDLWRGAIFIPNILGNVFDRFFFVTRAHDFFKAPFLVIPYPGFGN
jgi:hypothetical protein